MSNTDLQTDLHKEIAIQDEQQSISNKEIFIELHKINENLKSISDSLLYFGTYGLFIKS